MNYYGFNEYEIESREYAIAKHFWLRAFGRYESALSDCVTWLAGNFYAQEIPEKM